MEEVTENTSSTIKTPLKKKKRPRFIRIVPCQVILHFQFKLACYSLYIGKYVLRNRYLCFHVIFLRYVEMTPMTTNIMEV